MTSPTSTIRRRPKNLGSVEWAKQRLPLRRLTDKKIQEVEVAMIASARRPRSSCKAFVVEKPADTSTPYLETAN